MKSLKDRAKFLVNRSHEGSVNAAARDIGVPQSTLTRVVDGRVKNPRANTLERIADYYQVDVGWLISGKGDAPHSEHVMDSPAYRWELLMNSLDLPEAVERRVQDLPHRTSTAFNVLALNKERHTTRSWTLPTGLSEAIHHEHLAWLKTFELWIRFAGRDAVRRSLLENIEFIAAGLPLQRPLTDRDLREIAAALSKIDA